MKRLKVPYLAGLDSLDLSSIGFFMESKAYRDYINEINWKNTDTNQSPCLTLPVQTNICISDILLKVTL